MRREDFEAALHRCLEEVRRLQGGMPPLPSSEGEREDDARWLGRLDDALRRFFERLADMYPFFHERYAGQMLKPPHEVAQLGYISAMAWNPNNHAFDGGPSTARMEQEVVAAIAKLYGWTDHLGHLTGGGTIANLEALWVAREQRPNAAIAASGSAHYTHARMAKLLRVPFVAIETDGAGRLDPADLERKMSAHEIGVVVATLGTTGLGALDPVDEIHAITSLRGAWLHVDAAYGGFHRLLADDSADGVRSAPFLAASRADSLVVDPHKHGLQPYGCGGIVYRDPSVAVHYLHDSPYTYFTTSERHLGEISLECSRSGAAAAALWLTLLCFPLDPRVGFGSILRRSRRAALAFADLVRETPELLLVCEPELDIVVFAPRPGRPAASAVSRLSEAVFHSAMNDPEDPIFLSKLRVDSSWLRARHPVLEADEPTAVVLRSCLMKPEHERAVSSLHERILAQVTRASAEAL
jgi:glutamate/tyrosine decarboxylase-like PLP-dependent enzyme